LSAFHRADGNCFLGQEGTAYGGIHATRTTIMAEVYCKTLEHFNLELFDDNPPHTLISP
jgi:hypothetical protein